MLRKTLVRISVLVLVLLCLSGLGVGYWHHIHIFVSTDDAYVYGYVGVVSARVPGRVAKVLVDDNQFVKPGQVLLTLEPQDYEAALAQAEGNLGRLRQDLAQNYVKVSTSRAKLAEAKANFRSGRHRQGSLYRPLRAPHRCPSRPWTTWTPATG